MIKSPISLKCAIKQDFLNYITVALVELTAKSSKWLGICYASQPIGANQKFHAIFPGSPEMALSPLFDL